MRLLLLLLLIPLMLCGCATPIPEETTAFSVPIVVPTTEAATLPPVTTVPADPVMELLSEMTLEEKVGQLFLARCSKETALSDISSYHLGGFVLFGVDFADETPDSLRETLNGYQAAAKIPLLLAVDEEGGTVTRISRYPAFRSKPFPSPRQSYSRGGLEQVLTNEEEKCQLLSSLGLNVNLGPVCDVTTDPGAFMYARSFGQDPQATGNFVFRTVQLMNRNQIGSVLKHFPGYGNNVDTHTGIAVDDRSLEALESADLLPFASGIAADCGAILVSHTIVSAMDDSAPASLSPAVHRYLRENMGYTGVILTDDLVMDAITDAYGAEEAAVLAVLAGNDLLCSTDYSVQYNAVLSAVQEGRIDLNTIDAAAERVLRWKQTLGLL